MSVPKFPPIPSLSVVIPIGRDLPAFENTLVSVLENRPSDCEVLVAHDGGYEDPFDLCDEVRFVTGKSASYAGLLSASFEAANGQIVHVLSDGLRATAGWTDDAVERFENPDTGAVTPVIRGVSVDEVAAAGWCDAGTKLCVPAGKGESKLSTKSIAKSFAPYIQAAFFRRELAVAMSQAFDGGNDTLSTSYAFGQLLDDAGWQSVVATESLVEMEGDAIGDKSSFSRGQTLRALQGLFDGKSGFGWSLTNAALAAITNPTRLVESLGQALAPLKLKQLQQRVDLTVMPDVDDDEPVLSLPETQSDQPLRRAA